MNKLIAKLSTLKSELGWRNLIGLALAIFGGLLFLPGSIIIGYFNMPAVGIAIILSVLLVCIGCEVMKDTPSADDRKKFHENDMVSAREDEARAGGEQGSPVMCPVCHGGKLSITKTAPCMCCIGAGEITSAKAEVLSRIRANLAARLQRASAMSVVEDQEPVHTLSPGMEM